jgi:hypothetical protein
MQLFSSTLQHEYRRIETSIFFNTLYDFHSLGNIKGARQLELERIGKSMFYSAPSWLAREP